MYKDLDILNTIDFKERQKNQDRWQDENGHKILKIIIDKIKNDEINHLLDADVQHGDLNGFLANEYDLKGITINNQDFKSDGSTPFHYINFSYSSFIQVTFNGFVFANIIFDFIDFSKCRFENCVFIDSKFYSCNIENCDFNSCDFIDKSNFRNSVISNSNFFNNFTDSVQIIDCKFDSNTKYNSFKVETNNQEYNNRVFQTNSLADNYLGLSDAYLAGKVSQKRIEYLFKSKKVYTKYNAVGYEKTLQLFIKCLTGYGLKPFRPFVLFVIYLFISLIVYSYQDISLSNSIELSISGFLAIGDTECLNPVSKFWFYLSGFAGIFTTGLFLGTLLNVWFNEK